MATSLISISPAPAARTRAEHWLDDKGTSFRNPWASWVDATRWELVQFMRKLNSITSADDKRDMPRADELVPRTKPTWGLPQDAGRMKVTWMGHAAALLEMPRDAGAPGADAVRVQSAATSVQDVKDAGALSGPSGEGRGVTVLFDPAFSKRCSPTQWAGSVRYQPPAASVEEIPEVDIIVLSHNHYDHQDNLTLSALFKRFAARPPLMLVPLNNTRSLPNDVPRDRVIEMDWWEEREVVVAGKGRVRMTCTPAQHMSARSLFDQGSSLWASWAVKHIPSETSSSSSPAPSFWFGGDTGYITTKSESLAHDANPSAPACPAFAQIGERLGPFSAAFIPIGAYGPRFFLSNVHVSPAESVRIFKDVRAKTALGIHWGTWHMAYEPVDEPPKILADVRGKLGVSEEQFGVSPIGETRAYDP